MAGDHRDMATIAEGDVIAGRYRVEQVLGAGPLGVVVSAQHLQLDTIVAIKLLLPNMVGDPDAVARFAREARAAARITNEHVTRVLDVGTHEGGAPYMVMEFLEGMDLEHWLRMRGRLSYEQATEFLLQTSEAVAEAHSLGIIHRDLKPANLFVVRRPNGLMSIKVQNFGISKIINMTGRGIDTINTRVTSLMGSPAYMAPEQLDSPHDVDARTDIWALGVILFELLTGTLPFYAQRVPDLCRKIIDESPPLLVGLRPDAPPALQALITKCLEKDPNERYTNVAALAFALAEFAPKRARLSVVRILRTTRAAGLAPHAPTVPTASERPSFGTAAKSIGPIESRPPEKKRRKAALAALVATTAAACLAIVAAATWSTRSAGPKAAAVAPVLESGASSSVGGGPPAGAGASSYAPSPVRTTTSPTAAPSANPSATGSALSAPANSGDPHGAVPGPHSHKPHGPARRTNGGPASSDNGCDAPYSIDADGIKRYRPECL
jgi:serine/threonine-protein kinase